MAIPTSVITTVGVVGVGAVAGALFYNYIKDSQKSGKPASILITHLEELTSDNLREWHMQHDNANSLVSNLIYVVNGRKDKPFTAVMEALEKIDPHVNVELAEEDDYLLQIITNSSESVINARAIVFEDIEAELKRMLEAAGLFKEDGSLVKLELL